MKRFRRMSGRIMLHGEVDRLAALKADYTRSVNNNVVHGGFGVKAALAA